MQKIKKIVLTFTILFSNQIKTFTKILLSLGNDSYKKITLSFYDCNGKIWLNISIIIVTSRLLKCIQNNKGKFLTFLNLRKK